MSLALLERITPEIKVTKSLMNTANRNIGKIKNTTKRKLLHIWLNDKGCVEKHTHTQIKYIFTMCNTIT